ncbi:hypothetical protein [Catellatospora sp. NPDC049609]|uniref:hypothetical protein n=1 Tax=Catellatospora sp. NPDC049609 TaxID=3155505 RepID=UPI00342AF13E
MENIRAKPAEFREVDGQLNLIANRRQSGLPGEYEEAKEAEQPGMNPVPGATGRPVRSGR